MRHTISHRLTTKSYTAVRWLSSVATIRTFALSLLFASLSILGAQETTQANEPDWLVLERGRLAFDSREYGEALRLFRKVKESNTTMPEIDIEIGRVFEAEGEMDLALIQYERAYERRALLIVPADAIDLLYTIARIRSMREEYLQYEELLRTIVEEIDGRFPQPPTQLTDPIYRILIGDGVDKLLELYRIDDRGSQQAYHLLAKTLLYKGRRFIEASKFAAFSVIMTVTELISFAMYIDPEFEFEGIEALLGATGRFEHVSEYLDRSDFFDQLFVLGQALYSSDRFSTAEEIRSLLVRSDPGGLTGIRAARGYTPL